MKENRFEFQVKDLILIKILTFAYKVNDDIIQSY